MTLVVSKIQRTLNGRPDGQPGSDIPIEDAIYKFRPSKDHGGKHVAEVPDEHLPFFARIPEGFEGIDGNPLPRPLSEQAAEDDTGDVAAEIDRLESLVAQLQGERDSARAEVERLAAELNTARQQIENASRAGGLGASGPEPGAGSQAPAPGTVREQADGQKDGKVTRAEAAALYEQAAGSVPPKSWDIARILAEIEEVNKAKADKAAADAKAGKA